ncbi:hypothetical protein Golob_024618 [Gossypium lobatum]|uniref:Uncharacterized protein n=1 Tax=Gossypium lobatum TaxID=34289 RepID=A0A7J8NEM0_9ROSI|nr:hypothetical protein [Gossypium lobatum]
MAYAIWDTVDPNSRRARELYCRGLREQFVMLNGTHLHLTSWPFRCLASWMLHDEFKGLVKEHWRNDEEIMNNLKRFQIAVQDWNKRVYENLFVRK